ncbi:17843_t:CDS:2, partial [Funneliformis caledonium]
YEKNVVDGITKIPIVSLWYLDNTPSSSRTTSISKTDFPSRSTPPSPGLCLNCEINNEYLHHHRQELKKNVRSCLAAATMCFRFNSSMYLIHHEPPAQGLIIHLRSSGILYPRRRLYSSFSDTGMNVHSRPSTLRQVWLPNW